MGVPILPILGALSTVASTAWDTYTRIKRTRETLADKSAVSARLEALENTSLEQAKVLSELSKDLEQFAQAIQAEVDRIRKRQTLFMWLCCVSLATTIGLSLFLLMK
jgi:hypothetical protein